MWIAEGTKGGVAGGEGGRPEVEEEEMSVEEAVEGATTPGPVATSAGVGISIGCGGSMSCGGSFSGSRIINARMNAPIIFLSAL